MLTAALPICSAALRPSFGSHSFFSTLTVSWTSLGLTNSLGSTVRRVAGADFSARQRRLPPHTSSLVSTVLPSRFLECDDEKRSSHIYRTAALSKRTLHQASMTLAGVAHNCQMHACLAGSRGSCEFLWWNQIEDINQEERGTVHRHLTTRCGTPNQRRPDRTWTACSHDQSKR